MAVERPSRPHGGGRKVGRYALLVVVAVIVLVPDLRDGDAGAEAGPDVLDHPRRCCRSTSRSTRCATAWNDGDLGRLLVNSIVMSVLVTVGVIVTSVLARTRSRSSSSPASAIVFALFLATLLVPLEVTVVVNRRTIEPRLDEPLPGLVVPFLATAFGTFLVRQVFLHDPQRAARGRGARRRSGHLALPVRGRRAAVPADARRARRC